MDNPKNNTLYIPETTSTNEYFWEILRKDSFSEGFVVYTDYQTSGRGQSGNSWESAKGKNLLFSLLLKPSQIDLSENFLISQIVSVGIKRALSEYTEDITIKWANDIYWGDEKLVGILIENSLQGAKIKESVIGIGINVNQEIFHYAPNPTSLKNITSQEFSIEEVLEKVHEHIMSAYKEDAENIRQEYMNSLYRKDGFHTYEDEHGKFSARIKNIQPDGRLDLITRDNSLRSYYFKEVRFVI